MISANTKQPALAAEKEFDLDFTIAAPRPVKPVVKTEVRSVTETEIGIHEIKKAGNEVIYVRTSESRPAAASDGPILVVEDNETTRRLLAKILEELGYPVRTAADARELVQVLRQPPLPRLILLDVELPQISGFQLLEQLRQHPQTGKVPIVMLTARSENKDILRGLALGADGYLSKPIKSGALRSVVDKVSQSAARGAGR